MRVLRQHPKPLALHVVLQKHNPTLERNRVLQGEWLPVLKAESSDLEFHSRRGKSGGFVCAIAKRFVGRMPATAQADPRFLDQFFAAIDVANRVRTVGVNANRAVLVDGEFHAGSLPAQSDSILNAKKWKASAFHSFSRT